MRLKQEHREYIKNHLGGIGEDIDIYLFGSRVNDLAKGGDIDILLLSEVPVDRKLIRNFRIGFFKKFGWQKIDIVSFLKREKSTFKEIALENSIKL
jgi:predicted nucleotidyltransferase